MVVYMLLGIQFVCVRSMLKRSIARHAKQGIQIIILWPYNFIISSSSIVAKRFISCVINVVLVFALVVIAEWQIFKHQRWTLSKRFVMLLLLFLRR